jgi:hypothetical protein
MLSSHRNKIVYITINNTHAAATPFRTPGISPIIKEALAALD